MKTNKEILREYLDLAIQAEFTFEVIKEVSSKGRSTDSYAKRLDELANSLERYVSSYPWIIEVFKVKELE